MNPIRFATPPRHEAAEALRHDVRAFLHDRLAHVPPIRRADSWTGVDKDFTRAMGARGWLGMTWPKCYGGHERSAFERYVVMEETLAAGAPVGAHWIGDRQSGPTLLKFGTEAQRRAVLPRIAAGQAMFCIGMSE
ncbi:acyl-CoA dehydrogenase family protein, partial [Sphingobium sp. UBA5915]